MARIGSRNIRNFILGNRRRQRLRIPRAPAQDGRALEPLEQVVLGQRLRNPVAVIELVELDLLAVDRAALVDIMNRFGNAKRIVLADIRGRAGHIVERSHLDIGGACPRRKSGGQNNH